jgi:hypothetical protein
MQGDGTPTATGGAANAPPASTSPRCCCDGKWEDVLDSMGVDQPDTDYFTAAISGCMVCLKTLHATRGRGPARICGWAVYLSNADVLRYLMRMGYAVDRYALEGACERGNVEAVRLLLRDPDAEVTRGAVRAACYLRDTGCLRELLSHGVEVGRVAFHIASDEARALIAARLPGRHEELSHLRPKRWHVLGRAGDRVGGVFPSHEDGCLE